MARAIGRTRRGGWGPELAFFFFDDFARDELGKLVN